LTGFNTIYWIFGPCSCHPLYACNCFVPH